MVWCKVKPCRNSRNKPGIRMYSFPTRDESRFALWELAAGYKRLELDRSKSHWLCHIHFAESSIQMKDLLTNVPPEKRRLNEEAIPTLCLPTAPSERDVRQETRKRKIDKENILADISNLTDPPKRRLLQLCDAGTQSM